VRTAPTSISQAAMLSALRCRPGEDREAERSRLQQVVPAHAHELPPTNAYPQPRRSHQLPSVSTSNTGPKRGGPVAAAANECQGVPL